MKFMIDLNETYIEPHRGFILLHLRGILYPLSVTL